MVFAKHTFGNCMWFRIIFCATNHCICYRCRICSHIVSKTSSIVLSIICDFIGFIYCTIKLELKAICNCCNIVVAWVYYCSCSSTITLIIYCHYSYFNSIRVDFMNSWKCIRDYRTRLWNTCLIVIVANFPF